MISVVRINIRASKEEKWYLIETADRLGLSLSAFIREAAIKRAKVISRATPDIAEG